MVFFARRERLEFDIRPVHRSTWLQFAKYHYLSDRLPGGQVYTFGIFMGDKQIGFQCFANYTPTRKGVVPIFHSNRTVIHPDYAGLGMGIKLINITSEYMVRVYGYRIMGKFSSEPVFRAMKKQPCWRHLKTERRMGKMNRGGGDGAVVRF